jgi:hypothetical protein
MFLFFLHSLFWPQKKALFYHRTKVYRNQRDIRCPCEKKVKNKSDHSDSTSIGANARHRQANSERGLPEQDCPCEGAWLDNQDNPAGHHFHAKSRENSD